MDDYDDALEDYRRTRYDEIYDRWDAAVDLVTKIVVLAAVTGVIFLMILK